MISTQQKVILTLVLQKVQIIKKYLSEQSFSTVEITKYLLRILFSQSKMIHRQSKIQQNSQICAELSKYIKERKAEGESIKDVLSEMLGTMERQCHIIEDCQKADEQMGLEQIGSIIQSQKGASQHRARKILLNKPLTTCSIRDKCEQVESSRRILNEINMIRSFEKELNENMLKTRLLKKLIQQKLQLEMEEINFSRINQFSQIALESTF